jgi:hypothetical protein
MDMAFQSSFTHGVEEIVQKESVKPVWHGPFVRNGLDGQNCFADTPLD